MARFFGKSRSEKRSETKLGIVHTGPLNATARNRSEVLDKIDLYLKGNQYDHLQNWDQSECSGDYVPIRKRKPKIIYPMAQLITERLSSKLLGEDTFPDLAIEQDPDASEFLQIILKGGFVKPALLSAIEKFVSHGSVFVRYKIVDGSLVLEHYNPKYCYPVFNDSGELEHMEIRFVFEDPEDLDAEHKPIKKWFKLELGKQKDTLYDNPIFNQNESIPQFEVESEAVHDLGFVQGEWFKTSDEKHSPDGKSIIPKVFEFIDSFNYNLSQTDRAVAYGVDPQLILKGIDEDEMEGLIKSSSKAWNLGHQGDANYLEVSGSGVEKALENKNELSQDMQDIMRVVILDPEKTVAHAQSAKAMEVMHGPMLELINQYRPFVAKSITKLMQKIMLTLVILNQRGAELSFQMPPQWKPTSIDINVSWPRIFPLTTLDIQQIVGVGVQLASANIVSRESVLRWLMKEIDLGIDDIENEILRINGQKEFNTFGF